MQDMGQEEIAVYVNNVAKIRSSYEIYIKCIYASITNLYSK